MSSIQTSPPNSAASQRAGWPDLPAEIRWKIRDYINTLIRIWPDSNPPLPQLPLVCHEWYTWWPHINFRFIVLDQDRLDDFSKFVGRHKERRESLRYVVLRIRLPEYDCPACDEEEDDATAFANDSIFMDTMQRFTAIESRWEDVYFTLDLGVYSPSDGKHGFRDFRFSEKYRYGASAEM